MSAKDISNSATELPASVNMEAVAAVRLRPAAARPRRHGVVPILDMTIATEMVIPFLIGCFACIVILLGQILYVVAQLIIQQGIPVVPVVKFLILKVPFVAILALPVATLLATSLVLNRMTRDSELVALRTGGIAFARIVRPFLIVALVMSGVSYGINEHLVPWTNHQAENIIRQLAQMQPVTLIQQGKYLQIDNRYHVFVREVDLAADQLRGIMVYEQDAVGYGFPRVYIAQVATEKDGVWTLYKVVVHEYDPQGHLEKQGSLDKVTLNLKETINDFWGDTRTPDEMPGDELKKEIDLFKKSGIGVQQMEVDYYRKFSLPFACLVLTLIAAPLSVRWARNGGFVGLLVTFVLVFFYNGTMNWARALGNAGELNPILAAWGQNIIFGAIGLVLLMRER